MTDDKSSTHKYVWSQAELVGKDNSLDLGPVG